MSSKLLLHFIEYRVDQLNKKHMKIAVNSTTQYFKRQLSKDMSAKSLNFWSTYHKMAALEKFCEIERKSSFNSQYFQTSQISDIWFN